MIDFSGLPDQEGEEKKIDFSGLPDKGGEIDFSGLPDQPTSETILGIEPTGGTWKATLKAAFRVPLAIAGAMAATPGAGIEAAGKLLPRIPTDPDRPWWKLESGSLIEAAETLEKRIGVIPEAVIKTPEEAESLGLVEKYGMWPIRKSGEGWGMIGKATGIPYAEPLLGTMGEAAAMGAMGGETGKAIKLRTKRLSRGLAAKNIEKLRIAQESKYGRYGVVPKEELLLSGESAKPSPIPVTDQLFSAIGEKKTAKTISLNDWTEATDPGTIITDFGGIELRYDGPFQGGYSFTPQEGVAAGKTFNVKKVGRKAIETKLKWKKREATEATLTDAQSKALTEGKEIILEGEKYGLKVMELIGKRRAEIDKSILDSEIFIKQFERDFNPAELEAIPFIRQGIKDPNVLKKIGQEDLISIIKNPSKELLQATEKIGGYYDESFAFLQKHWGDINYVKDYVTHVWDIPKNRQSEVVSYFATKNPFTKKRKIPTLEEGISLGLKPKTTNIVELLRIYDQFKVKTVHNLNFANDLKKLVGVDGEPLMLRADKAPIDWIMIDHPAMNRAIMIGKAGEKPVLSKIPIKVHPEIAKEVKIIFDKPFSHGATRALETINAFAKKGMLSLSFFHHHALTESAFSTGIGRKAIKQWNPYKIYKALKSKDYEIFKQQELAKDAIDHGVTFGAITDVQRTRVVEALRGLERIARGTPGAKQLTKGIRAANDLWDAALWDYYHNSLKLWAYEKNVFDALKFSKKRLGRDLLPEEITALKKEMAGFVDDSFGGQNWEFNRVLGNPKTRQMLHWVLLAPDWTFSVLKQAAAPAKGIVKQITARKAPTEMVYIQQRLAGKALTRQGAKFWAKAALYFNLIAQSVNYAMAKKEYGEGRFTWDNPEGHSLNIFIGRNEDGTEKYLRMGKQFREVLEWGTHPIKKAGAKLSPVLREDFVCLFQFHI